MFSASTRWPPMTVTSTRSTGSPFTNPPICPKRRPQMPTRTANLPIGLRRLGSDWNSDLPTLLAWAKESGFETLDLTAATPADVAAARAAGLRLGSVDLLEMGKLLVNDAAERKDRIERNIAHVKELAAV